MEIGKATFFENRLRMELEGMLCSSSYKSPNKTPKTAKIGANEDTSTAEKAVVQKHRGNSFKRDLASLGVACHESRYLLESQKGFFSDTQRKEPSEEAKKIL
jgi:hypothetical protein